MSNDQLIYDAKTVTSELQGLKDASDGGSFTLEEITTWADNLMEKYTRHLSRRLLRFADLNTEVCLANPPADRVRR